MRPVKLLFAVFILASCSRGTSPLNDERKNITLLWRIESFNWITSSILIKNDKIYFGSFNDAFHSATLTDGAIKSTSKTTDDPYFSPLINENRIYFSSFDLNLYCVDSLGKLIWKKKTIDRIKNNLVEDDSVLFVPVRSDGLRAMRKSDGTTIWHLPQNPQALSTNRPTLYRDKVFIGNWDLDNKVMAVNKTDGKPIWTNKYSGYSSSDAALSPNGLVISLDRYYKGGQVKMLDFQSGKEVWSVPLKCEPLYQPFTNNECVIVSTYDNKIVRLNNIDGRTQWTLDLQTEENADTKIVSFQKHIYFGTTKRNLYCVDINSGKTLFIEPFNYGLSEPLVANDNVYFPTGGNELWTLKK
jgi:outer membrane protein assembly factor BamB